jgi:hypothetical protein
MSKPRSPIDPPGGELSPGDDSSAQRVPSQSPAVGKPTMMISICAIVFGGSLGCLLRWYLAMRLNALFPQLPPGTLAANIIGGYGHGRVPGVSGAVAAMASIDGDRVSRGPDDVLVFFGRSRHRVAGGSQPVGGDDGGRSRDRQRGDDAVRSGHGSTGAEFSVIERSGVCRQACPPPNLSSVRWVRRSANKHSTAMIGMVMPTMISGSTCSSPALLRAFAE